MSDVLAQEVDADSWLYPKRATLSLSSNLLLTNRSMMLVLPVLVSPNRMTLKVRLPMVEEVIDMFK